MGDVRPGEVIAWVPTGTSRAALEACPADPRPLTHDQERHLSAPSGRNHQDADEVPWIAVACLLADARPASVAAALASLFDRHESLRCDYTVAPFATPGGAPGRAEPFVRRVLPAGVVEFEPVPLGRQETALATHAAVMAHLGATANPVAWPHSGFVTIESEGRVTLVAAFDHVTFDGYSMYTVAAEIPLLHRVFAAGDAPDPALALSGSHLDHAVDERGFARSLTSRDPLLGPWRELLDESGRVPALPAASGVRRGGQLSHDLVSLPVAAPGEASAFRELCGSWGVSYGLSFIALLLRAIAAQEGPGPSTIRTMMSTHGRSSPYLGSMGWFAGVAPLTVDVDPAAELRDSTAAIGAAWARSAPSGRIPLALVGDLLETSVDPSLVVSFIDAKHCPGWRDWRATEARGFLGRVPPSDQMHAWISCLPSGTFLEVRHPDSRQCASWVASLAVTMRTALLSSLDPRRELVPSLQTPGA
ncbi:hypothetical protein [Nocardioides piscis]|uniref:Condensation domain-containing protein n=1 Tax=Nocardioides piscis TaxID=2714938 RepID=A0A6G7YJA0_9ACTN|nr:hypothetical protein [Nocardioides piscis]QIK76806.1 hypothetical protein G7071_16605 [Nocardioides piscis]